MPYTDRFDCVVPANADGVRYFVDNLARTWAPIVKDCADPYNPMSETESPEAAGKVY